MSNNDIQLAEFICQQMGNLIETKFDSLNEKLDGMKSEYDKKLDNHEDRLGNLEGQQKKALVGFAAIAALCSVVIGSVWGWISKKIGLSE